MRLEPGLKIAPAVRLNPARLARFGQNLSNLPPRLLRDSATQGTEGNVALKAGQTAGQYAVDGRQ